MQTVSYSISMNINDILKLSENAIADSRSYTKKRFAYQGILSEKGKHFVGIVGPRGVGKTIILKQLAHDLENACYISLDTLAEDLDLFELVQNLSKTYKYTKILIDEINFLKKYPDHLKKIYDFLDVRIFFTSSVSISLYSTTVDLSRRVCLLELFPFTFREYLYFTQDVIIPQLELTDILNEDWQSDHLHFSYLFDDYLKMKLYPFVLDEPEPYALFKNILYTIIHKDIPALVPHLKIHELSSIEKLVQFIGQTSVDGLNYTSFSKNLGITKYKAEEYVTLLNKAFVLKTVFPIGTNVLKEPKILMYLPFRLLFISFEKGIGALREDFFSEMMQIKTLPYHYLKTNRGKKTPDFLVLTDNRKIVIEVGGAGKGAEQFKGIDVQEKLILSHANETKQHQRPLVLLGFI